VPLCYSSNKKEREDIPIPEGPELRHSRDILRKTIVGETIIGLTTTDAGRYKEKRPEGFEKILTHLPLKVVDVEVKGKFMWWTLEGPSIKCFLWSTYGMSGQWSLKHRNHTCFIVDFGSKRLHFVDPRHFGTIKFVFDPQEHQKKLSSLGPDILEDPPMTPEIFAKRILLKPNRTISENLMDQRCISGVGNYLKAESLHRSGVSPHRVVVEMTADEIERLWSEVILSCRESYADHGASIRTYKTVEGENGGGQFHFRVYGMKRCPKGHEVVREETADGRTSWWCKDCQV
jgi:DNA-formamidopyrimidine glycosylase